MSVLNKTLKAIEQRDNTAELGLEPTVELNKARELPKSVMYVIVIGLACALVGAAYLFIPKRPVSVPMTPALVHEAELSQQAKPQPDKPAQPLTHEDQKHVVTVNEAAQQQVELSDEATIVQQPSTATLPAQQMIADDVITANEAHTSAIPTAPQSPPESPVDTVSQAIVKKTEPTNKTTQAQAAQSENETVVVTALSNVERAERWYQQGQQSLSYSMIDEAIAQFEQALHLAPSHKSARTMLAATLYGQQRSDEANSVLVDGLQRQPSVLEWRVLIAKMATEQKQYSRVLAALGDEYDEHALRLAQNDYWILKGSAARNLKRFDIAKTSFTVLIKRQPNVAKWWLALATSEDGLGELQAAKSHYGTALQLGGLSMQSQRFARARYEQL